MFTEEFNSIITNPHSLQDVPLADLKVLAERYPWCQPVQVLYARKLFLVESPQFEHQLHRTAILSYDREVLFKYINAEIPEAISVAPEPEVQPVQPVIVEEHQEIQPVVEISEPELDQISVEEFDPATEELIQEMIESIPEVHQEDEIAPIEMMSEETMELQEEEIEAESMLQEEMDLENLDHAVINDDMEAVASNPLPDERIEPDEAFIFEMPAYDIETELGTLDEADKFTLPNIPPEVAAEKNTEVFTDSFTGWLNRLGGSPTGKVVEQKASNAPVKVYLRKQPTPGSDPAGSAHERLMNEQYAAELARKSIQSDDGLISETYARILVMQGKYQRASEMYRKLSLLKPQKSDYFAALIDQINKKIK